MNLRTGALKINKVARPFAQVITREVTQNSMRKGQGSIQSENKSIIL